MGIYFKNLGLSSTSCVISSRCITMHVTNKLLPCFLSPLPVHFMKELLVNLDPVVLEVLYETKYLRKMDFEVPDVVLGLCADEEQIKRHHME